MMDKELLDFLHEFKNDMNKRFIRLESEMMELKKELWNEKIIGQEQLTQLNRLERVMFGIGHQFEHDTLERVAIKVAIKALEKRVEDLEKRIDH